MHQAPLAVTTQLAPLLRNSIPASTPLDVHFSRGAERLGFHYANATAVSRSRSFHALRFSLNGVTKE
jgi:hypothetical protein